MNCKKCEHFDWYELASEEGDMTPFDPKKVDRDHCGHFLCNDDRGPCPIVKSKAHKIWVKFLWLIGYYPLDKPVIKKLEINCPACGFMDYKLIDNKVYHCNACESEFDLCDLEDAIVIYKLKYHHYKDKE